MTNLRKLFFSQQQTWLHGHLVVMETVIYGAILDFSLTLLPSFVGTTLLEPGMHEFLFLDGLVC